MDSVQKEIIYLTMQLDLQSRKVRAIIEEVEKLDSSADIKKINSLMQELAKEHSKIKKISAKIDKLLSMPIDY